MKQFVQASRQKRRVLVVDDEMINRELLEAILALNYDVTSASNGSEAMDILNSMDEPFSLILLDLLMPQMSGFQVLEACKSDDRLKKIPIIVMTSEKSAEVRSINMGASDFIPKPYRMPEVILARCERIVELSEEKQLIHSIEADPVTGLYVSSFFFAYIRRMLSNMRLAMDAAVIRIEGLERIRRQFGAKESDCVLQTVADLISRELIKTKGLACRTADDEIYVYCRHKTNYEELLGNMQRLLSQAFPTYGLRLQAGVFEKADKTVPIERWFELAGAACDNIDENDLTHLYNSIEVPRRISGKLLAAELQTAISENRFTIKFETCCTLDSGSPSPVSVQAKMVWNHPVLGMLEPERYMPPLEKEGVLCQAEQFLLRETASLLRSRIQGGARPLPVWITCSCARTLKAELPRIEAQLPDAPGIIVPLFSEEALACDDEAADILNSLAQRGYQIAVDNFGSGNTNLKTLAALPVSILKTNASLAASAQTPEGKKAVGLTLQIASALGVKAVFGGVETEQQLEALRALGCTELQGGLFSDGKELP